MSEIGKLNAIPKKLSLDMEWEIKDFFSLSEKDGTRYWSPEFSFDGQTWSLRIHPNGASWNYSFGHIDLWLCRKSPGIPNRQEFSFAFKTLHAKKVLERHRTGTFKGLDSHGFPRFISRFEVSRRKSELLPSGVLTVVCSIKYSGSVGSSNKKSKENSENSSKEASTQTEKENADKKCKEISENSSKEASTQTGKENVEKKFKENSENSNKDASTQTEKENGEVKDLQTEEVNKTDKLEAAGCNKSKASGSKYSGGTETKESVSLINLPEVHGIVTLPEVHGIVTDVNQLLKERRGIDVTFVIEFPSDKTEFFAHKLILAVMSSYFADEFYSKQKNKEHHTIILKGINPKAFNQLIRFCYGYKPSLKTTEEVCALFKVASQFKVVSLLNLCCSLCRHTSIEAGNVFSILEISEEMDDKSLKDSCYKILQEKTREVLASYELCCVTLTMVHIVLDLPKLSLKSEYELIRWIFDWTKVKLEEKDSIRKSTRNYLDNFLQDFNFMSLTGEEFAMLCKENPDFFSTDEMASISLNIALPGTRKMPDWHGRNLKLRVYTKLNE